MDHSALETSMKENYGRIAQEYRANDEQDALGKDHHRVAAILGDICESFGRPILVLEAGCGTGRYFHALRRVKKLLGMDISAEMLEAARTPVQAKDVTIEETELVCGSFYTADFPPGSFDFIYLLGVFGNGCQFTPELCAKLHRWLSPDGCLYFDCFDIMGLPPVTRLRRRLKEFADLLLPKSIREARDAKNTWLPFHFSSKSGIESLFHRAGFPHTLVVSHNYQLTTGPGKKLECFASKRSLPAARPRTGKPDWEHHTASA